MKSKIKAFKNILLMSAPEYIAGFSVFAILIFLSKKASLSEIGELTFANTTGQLIASMIGVALLTTMRRDFVLETRLRDKYAVSLYITRILIFLAVCITSFLLFEFNFFSKIVLLMIASRGIDSLSETYYYTLLSKDKILKFSILKSLHYISLILSVTFGVYQNLDLFQISCIFLLNSIVWCIINFIFLFIEQNIKEFILFDDYQKDLFKRAFPLLLSSSVYLMSTRLNIFIVKKVCSPAEFGLFSIIITIMGIFSIFTSAISSFIINKQIEWYKESLHKLKINSIKLTIPFFGAGFFILLVFYFGSDYITYLFKNFDMNHVWLLKISLISIVIYFIQIPFNYLFTIIDKNKVALYFSMCMIVVAALLYYPFTNYFGLTGAVVAFLAYNILWCSILFMISIYIINKQILKESE
jgi:O-antigen/teichoic acid export membrane protein